VEIKKLYIVNTRLEENSLISEDKLILNAPSKIRINNVNVVHTGAMEARSSGDVYPNPLGPIKNPSMIRNNTSGMLVRRNNASDRKPKIAIKLIASSAVLTFITLR
tara:strand:- start:931 stop:1248 length:318 start_codon:yes stop_codon:yes gene_type:complete